MQGSIGRLHPPAVDTSEACLSVWTCLIGLPGLGQCALLRESLVIGCLEMALLVRGCPSSSVLLSEALLVPSPALFGDSLFVCIMG